MTERTEEASLPTIYGVNWFRKDLETGKFLWPGFGENSRVLEWIFRRLDGDAAGADTPDRRRANTRPTSISTGSTSRCRRSAPRSPSTPTSGAVSCPRLRASFDALGERLPAAARRACARRAPDNA